MGKKDKVDESHLKEEEMPMNSDLSEEPVTNDLADSQDFGEQQKDQNKIKELEEFVKRQAADFDNFRKRLQEEKERTKDLSRDRVILDFLPIFDNIERAFDSMQSEDTSLESIKIGFEGIMALFLDFLDKQGIQKLDSVGMPFDSKIHEALFTKEGDYSEKEVIQEVEKAYIRGDKVIRTAKVGVGIPKIKNEK